MVVYGETFYRRHTALTPAAVTPMLPKFSTTLAIFDLQVTPMLPNKFQVYWPFGSADKAKIDFKDGGPLDFRSEQF